MIVQLIIHPRVEHKFPPDLKAPLLSTLLTYSCLLRDLNILGMIVQLIIHPRVEHKFPPDLKAPLLATLLVYAGLNWQSYKMQNPRDQLESPDLRQSPSFWVTSLCCATS